MPGLQVLIGHMENELSGVDGYFDNRYELSWIENPLAIEILKDICDYQSHVGHAITVKSIFDHENYVTISMRGLPSGVKALLIMLNTDEEFVSATRCGENCIKWIEEISKVKDLKITINYPVRFEVPTLILNDGSTTMTGKEFAYKYNIFRMSRYDENMNKIE